MRRDGHVHLSVALEGTGTGTGMRVCSTEHSPLGQRFDLSILVQETKGTVASRE